MDREREDWRFRATIRKTFKKRTWIANDIAKNRNGHWRRRVMSSKWNDMVEFNGIADFSHSCLALKLFDDIQRVR